MHDLGKTNVLIVGSGGREHAIAWKILQSQKLGSLYVAPGNGGTEEHNIPIRSNEVEKLAEFAKEHNCFTIVGPEAPLALGIADKFQSEGLPIFAPTREQAKLETSKVYAKEFMSKAGIPTAHFKTFSDPESARAYSHQFNGHIVVKADGLAAGKGVFVCSTIEESEHAIKAILEERIFGESGDTVVLEERLSGREVSFMALCDGKSATPFGSATDHKRLLDGDKGPNTGGMGAYSPVRDFPEELNALIMNKVVNPTVRLTGFLGFLFVGLILTSSGPKVLEFNSRLGDPETQVLLPRLESDLLVRLLSVIKEGRRAVDLEQHWSTKSVCCVVMCSGGYPSAPRIGDEISGITGPSQADVMVFHSGTKKIGEKFLTNGGRVLCVTARANTLTEASKKAYDRVNEISWHGEYHRKDIGTILVGN